MMIRKFAFAGLVALGLGAASTASAQSWGGFYVDGAIGARNTNSEVKTSLSIAGVGTDSSNTDSIGQTNFLAEFSGGWRWASAPLGTGVLVGVGGFLDWAGNDAGKGDSSTTAVGVGTISEGFNIKQKNRYGLSVDIAPNWRTHPYAKLTYAWSKIDANVSVTGCSGATTSNTHSGWGIGAGVRHLQTNNLYFFGEFMWQDYDSKSQSSNVTCGLTVIPTTSSISPQNLVGVIGVGWKF